MEQNREILRKAKTKVSVGVKDGARRSGAGNIRDRCEAEQQRLDAKAVMMSFRDPKGRDRGTEFFAVR